MSLASHLRNLSRPLIQYRVILSFGLSSACGIFLESLYPVHDADPMLRLLELQSPMIFHGLVWSYVLFLYSTPFLVFSKTSFIKAVTGMDLEVGHNLASCKIYHLDLEHLNLETDQSVNRY